MRQQTSNFPSLHSTPDTKHESNKLKVFGKTRVGIELKFTFPVANVLHLANFGH